MTDEELTIQVHVRRTGEVISVEIRPSITTYGDIVKIICGKINESEPSHYYLALNYESEMQDDIVFDPRLVHERFQMIMRTKWLLQYIAERTMLKQQFKLEKNDTSDSHTSEREDPLVSSVTMKEITPTTDISNSSDVIPKHDDSTSKNTNEENQAILGNVIRSTIKRIPKQEVQIYLHKALGKSFDIILMGSPRVGKSTLINAILKKDIAKTSAGRNACTTAMTYYEYEETYTSSIDDTSTIASKCSVRIWDAPGIEDWNKLDITKHIQNLVKEKNPICLIYCAAPGSYADNEHIKVVIDQCYKSKVFIALVVTNMYASDEVDDILENFKTLLSVHSGQMKAVGDVFYYGTVGLCTLVNSIDYEAQGVKMKPAGVDELMVGIMNSLSEEKLLQWCFALMDNGPFWIRAQSRIWKTFNYMKSWLGY